MKNTFGTSVSVTLFGESHGPAIGAVLDGMAPGIKIDEEYIAKLTLDSADGVKSKLKELAELKMPDLNANDVEAAMKIIAGTCRSMGVEVED